MRSARELKKIAQSSAKRESQKSNAVAPLLRPDFPPMVTPFARVRNSGFGVECGPSSLYLNLSWRHGLDVARQFRVVVEVSAPGGERVGHQPCSDENDTLSQYAPHFSARVIYIRRSLTAAGPALLCSVQPFPEQNIAL
jgi:hypothetical protein